METKRTKKKNFYANGKRSRQYTVYTDGGCDRNPGGKGGAAALILNDSCGTPKEVYRGFKSTTNNRMEIMAVIIGLRDLPNDAVVDLYSDSQYVVKTLTGKFAIKKNEDLWKKLNDVIGKKKINPIWVRGHHGNIYNERCDQLCTKAMNGKNLAKDTGYKETNLFATHKELKKRKGDAMTKPLHLPVQFSDETFLITDVQQYVARYHVKKKCAEKILLLATSKFTFGDYMTLKTDGVDHWSRKTKEELLEDVAYPKMTLDTITEYIKDEPNILSCLRWYHRGLPLYHSIRKILVDKEVKGNCNWKRS